MRRRKENGDRCHDCERRKDDQAEPRFGKKYEDQDNCEDVTIMNIAKIPGRIYIIVKIIR